MPGAVGRGPLPGPASSENFRFREMRLPLRVLLPTNTHCCCLPPSLHLPSTGHKQRLPERVPPCPGGPFPPRGFSPHPPGFRGTFRVAKGQRTPTPFRDGFRRSGARACFLVRRTSYASPKGGPSAFTVQPTGSLSQLIPKASSQQKNMQYDPWEEA